MNSESNNHVFQIDTASRVRAASYLQEFLDGRIHNNELDDFLSKVRDTTSQDAAISHLVDEVGNIYHDSASNYKISKLTTLSIGKSSMSNEEFVRHLILFFKSDRPYVLKAECGDLIQAASKSITYWPFQTHEELRSCEEIVSR